MNEIQVAAHHIQVVRLEAYDDVSSVRDRLQFAETRRVLLVFPGQGRILQRKLDLLMIQREATRRQLNIALVCQDPTVAQYAREIDLACFANVQQARAARWKRGTGRVFAPRPSNAPSNPYELASRASRLRQAPPSRAGLAGRIAFAVGGLLALVAVFLAIIPSATVRLSPAIDAINEPINLTADTAITQIDPRAGLLPAQEIEVLVQGDNVTLPSSGRERIEDNPAEGRITLTNQTDDPQFIPAGSVVSTAATPPQRFRTLADVPLPGQNGADANVEILALEDTRGVRGNVPGDSIGRIEGPLEGLVSVTNPAPTFGGGPVETAIVTEADHQRLLTLARAGVQQAGRNQLLLSLPSDDLFLVPDSVRLVEERPEWTLFSAQVGERSESVSLDMRGVVRATIVDQNQASQLALLTLSQRLPAGRELDDRSLRYRREAGQLDDQGRYTFMMFVEGNSPFAIDAEAVARRISGMPRGQAEQTLQNELILDPRRPPQIDISPIDIGRLPFLPVRIDVIVQRNP